MKRMACALVIAAGTGAVVGPAFAAPDPGVARLANGLQLSVAAPGLATSDGPVNLDINYRGGSIRSVELYVDNNKVFRQSVTNTDTHGNFSLKVDSSVLPEGDHDVLVILTEADGSTASSSIKVHVAGPETGAVAQISYPRANAIVQNVVPIELKLDAGIKAPYVAYLLDNEFQAIRNYAPYVYNWDSSKVADGPHTLTVEVYDPTTQELLKKTSIQVVVKNVGGFTNIQPRTPVAASANTNRIKEILGEAMAEPIAHVADEAAAITRSGSIVSAVSMRAAEPTSRHFAVRERLAPASIVPCLEPTMEQRGPIEFTVAAHKMPHGVVAAPAAISIPRPILLALPAVVAEPEASIDRPAEVADISPAHRELLNAGNVAARPGKNFAAPVTAPIQQIRRIALAPVIRQNSKPFVITPYVVPPVAYIRSHRVNGLNTFEVAFNNDRIAFDVAPRVVHGAPHAPFRAIFEHGGGQVQWFGKSQTVRAVSGSRQIEFKIGERTAKVNNRVVKLAYAPFVENGRAIVPVTFVGDALNVKVTYDARRSYLSLVGKGRN